MYFINPLTHWTNFPSLQVQLFVHKINDFLTAKLTRKPRKLISGAIANTNPGDETQVFVITVLTNANLLAP